MRGGSSIGDAIVVQDGSDVGHPIVVRAPSSELAMSSRVHLATLLSVQRWFSAFPNGRPGAGLLLLRVVVGLVMTLHRLPGVSSGAGSWWLGGVDLAGGAGGLLVLAGLLTPLATAWVASVLAISVFVSPPSALDGLSVVLLLSDCAVLALLGPGAWSLDARMFGRREIVIPRS